MTISMLLMILAFAAGPGTGQSIERSSSTTVQANGRDWKPETHCYINGTWVTPCPSEAPPPPPPDPPNPEIQQ